MVNNNEIEFISIFTRGEMFISVGMVVLDSSMRGALFGSQEDFTLN